MRRNDKPGFSLAELLISLLIISIVLAAAIPTITKRSGASYEKIWNWVKSSGNDAYFGVGRNQTAIIGSNMLKDGITYFDSGYSGEIDSDSDKLAIVRPVEPANSGDDTTKYAMKESHIGFYTMKSVADASTDSIEYAGRLALNKTNIALGIGSLQNLYHEDGLNGQKNTAIGHYALFNNTTGYRNTAMGYQALSKLKSDGSVASNNNAAFGMGACSNFTKGTNNICIGNYSGVDPSKNLKLTYLQSEDEVNDRLFIGSNRLNSDGTTPTDANNADLITGFTNYSSGNYDKELDVNARYFKVRTYDGAKDIFKFTATQGATASSGAVTMYTGVGQNYSAAGTTDYFGLADFNLYTKKSDSKTTALSFSGDSQNVYFNTNYAASGTLKTGAITLNNSLQIKMDDSSITTDPTLTGAAYKTSIKAKKDLDVNAKESMNILTNAVTGNYYAYINLFADASSNQITMGTDYIRLASVTSGATVQLRSDNALRMYSPKNINIDSDKSLELYSKEALNVNSEKSVNISSKEPLNLMSDGNVNVVAKGSYVNFTNKNSSTSHISINTADRKIIGVADMNAEDVHINSIGSVKEAINELYSRVSYGGGGGMPSDIRLKNVSGDSTAGLEEINKLQVKNYTYKNDKEKTPHVGVIAQELQKVFPNSVSEDKTGYLRIKTEEIFFAMVNSIKELCAKVQDLTAKVTGLDKRITELEKQNQQLKKQNEAFEKRLAKLEKKK